MNFSQEISVFFTILVSCPLPRHNNRILLQEELSKSEQSKWYNIANSRSITIVLFWQNPEGALFLVGLLHDCFPLSVSYPDAITNGYNFKLSRQNIYHKAQNMVDTEEI